MIFTMESFRKPPYVHGVTTMESFFEDQHNRRRFLRKYSPKLFRRLKKCKAPKCTNYHDNKNSFCDDFCKQAYEDSRTYADMVEYDSGSCAECVDSSPHTSRFLCYKLKCANEDCNSTLYDLKWVEPDSWCFNFQPKHRG